MADVKYSFASLLPEYSLVGLGLAAAAVSATALELVLAAWRQVAHGGRQVYNLRQTINCLAVYAILLLTGELLIEW